MIASVRLSCVALAAAASMLPMGAAQAAAVSISVGPAFIAADPAGSGRTAQVTLADGQQRLTFSNTGFDGTDPENTLGGLVGALNAANMVITLLGQPGGVVPFQSLTVDGLGGWFEPQPGSRPPLRASRQTT